MSQLKYWDGTAWVDAVIGAQGTAGIQGLSGTQGATGSGTQGANGADGTQGLTGIQGLTGVQGVQGIQGGSAGAAAVTQIQSTSTDVSFAAFTLNGANVPNILGSTYKVVQIYIDCFKVSGGDFVGLELAPTTSGTAGNFTNYRGVRFVQSSSAVSNTMSAPSVASGIVSLTAPNTNSFSYSATITKVPRTDISRYTINSVLMGNDAAATTNTVDTCSFTYAGDGLIIRGLTGSSAVYTFQIRAYGYN